MKFENASTETSLYEPKFVKKIQSGRVAVKVYENEDDIIIEIQSLKEQYQR